MAEATAPQGGRTGQSKAKVHEVVHKRLQDLRDQAKKMAQAIQGAEQRKWQVPQDFTGNLLDIPTLHEPSFERQDINDEYDQVTKDPQSAGTIGDVISLKLQLDYVACEERAFRARHTSLVRAMCLGHGRRIGQGSGNLWDNKSGIESVLSAFIAAGGASQGGTT